jgi:hypothetical protein
MQQARRNDESFQTELAIKFWVVPLFCELCKDLGMLILVLDSGALLGEEPEHEM